MVNTLKPKQNLLPAILVVSALSILAIAAQSSGLMSVVKFVTTREGWEAQKAQFSAVTSEWESMSAATKTKVDQFRQEEIQSEQNRVAAEKELESVLKKLASAKGELETIEKSASSAVELQRRAQAEEQTTLDAIQKIKTELSDLNKQKTNMQTQIGANRIVLEGLESRVTTNKATLESQATELQDNAQKLTQVENSIRTARETLRKTSDDVLAANNDLVEALQAQKEAVVATEAARNLAQEVEKYKSDKAKLAGELEAMSQQKQALEKDIATADGRLGVARTKLADYLDKWNNRDKLSQEIDSMNARVTSLKKTESDTTANIAKLTEQSIKLETKTKTLVEEVKNAESQLTDLKNKQKELLAELLELQKLKKDAENLGGKNNSTGER
jgi:chromosome segregation protein